MHAVVMESLEEFLAGTLEPVERRTIEAHIGNCAACREELQGMEDLNLLFGSLRVREAVAPGPGFYAGVAQQIAERKPAPSFGGFFALSPAFGSRLVFSCLLVVLAALGSFIVANERGYTTGPTPYALMAQQTQASFESAPAPESMLVTLANYEH